MRTDRTTAPPAFTALLLASALLSPLSSRAEAQSTDGAHVFLLAGRTTSSAAGADRSFAFPVENFGIGGGVEVSSSLFPMPLRATLSYDKFRGGPTTTLKATSLTVDALLRPRGTLWGVRPYLLGGLGVATVARSGAQVVDNGVPSVVPIARTTALELNAGLGLEYRRFFLEYRHSPYRVLGDRMPSRTAIRLGLRF